MPFPPSRFTWTDGDIEITMPGEKAATSGVMVALFPSLDVAQDLAVVGGEDPYDLHVTLCYLGKAAALLPGQAETLRRICAELAAQAAPLKASIGGYGRFYGSPEDGDPIVALIDAPALPELRQRLVEQLEAAGLPVAKDHGFTPHMTLLYQKQGEAPVVELTIAPIPFDALHVCIGEDRVAYLFGGS